VSRNSHSIAVIFVYMDVGKGCKLGVVGFGDNSGAFSLKLLDLIRAYLKAQDKVLSTLRQGVGNLHIKYMNAETSMNQCTMLFETVQLASNVATACTR